jgi:hypothetical protein
MYPGMHFLHSPSPSLLLLLESMLVVGEASDRSTPRAHLVPWALIDSWPSDRREVNNPIVLYTPRTTLLVGGSICSSRSRWGKLVEYDVMLWSWPSIEPATHHLCIPNLQERMMRERMRVLMTWYLESCFYMYPRLECVNVNQSIPDGSLSSLTFLSSQHSKIELNSL